MVATNTNGRPPSDALGNRILSKRPVTSSYRPVAHYQWGHQVRDLPLFSFLSIDSMLVDQTVQLGLAMRQAPLMGVEFAYKQGTEWVPGVKSDDEQVADFVERQLHKIWRLDIAKLLNAQVWGWAGVEVMYRVGDSGMIEYNGMMERHARDVRALGYKGELVGVEFSGVEEGKSRLGLGKALWHAHNQVAGSFYGQSVLRGAYSAWADKWLTGGALDVRRLYMHADAYGGRRMRYPAGTTEIDGEDVPNRDVAREILEQMKSGAIAVLPTAVDEHGNMLWDLEDIRSQGQPTHILEYPKDLDIEILRGLLIPDDFLISGQSGAWQGKQVPMQAFYTGLTQVALQVLRTVNIQMLMNLVRWNWGRDIPFEVDIKPIEVQMMEQQQGGGSNPAAGGFPAAAQQQEEDIPGGFDEFQMGVDPVAEAVGSGLSQVSDVIEAAAGIAREPAHDWASTQFDIPHDISSQIKHWAAQTIDPQDLLEGAKSLEEEHHITVLYGIHQDDATAIAYALRDYGPVAVRLGEFGVFAQDDEDVLWIGLDSQTIHNIRHRLDDVVPNTQTYPEYIPHLTVARLKPGAGAKYADEQPPVFDEVVSFDYLTFSDRDRHKHVVQLNGPVMFSTELDDDDHQLATWTPFTTRTGTTGARNAEGKRIYGEEAKRALAGGGQKKPPKEGKSATAGLNDRQARFVSQAADAIKNGRKKVASRMINFARREGVTDEQLKMAGIDPDRKSVRETRASAGRARRVAREQQRSGMVKVVRRDGKITVAGGGKLPKHIKANMIPPRWKDVKINPDPDANLYVTAKDEKGRSQYVYNASFSEGRAAAKFARVSELAETVEAIKTENDENLGDEQVGEEAAIIRLIMATGMRPGSGKDTKAAKKAFGASTLEGRHVKKRADGTVSLQYVGKKGVRRRVVIDDPELAADLARRSEAAGPKGQLFNSNATRLQAYTKELGEGKFQTKDFRTHLGTKTAAQEISAVNKKGKIVIRGKKPIQLPPQSVADYKKAVRHIGTKVADKLGNTPAVAVASYIEPTLFAAWKESAGV